MSDVIHWLSAAVRVLQRQVKELKAAQVTSVLTPSTTPSARRPISLHQALGLDTSWGSEALPSFSVHGVCELNEDSMVLTLAERDLCNGGFRPDIKGSPDGHMASDGDADSESTLSFRSCVESECFLQGQEDIIDSFLQDLADGPSRHTGESPLAADEDVFHSVPMVLGRDLPQLGVSLLGRPLHKTDVEEDLRSCEGRPGCRMQRDFIKRVSRTCASYIDLPAGLGIAPTCDLRYALAMAALDKLDVLNKVQKYDTQTVNGLVELLDSLTAKAVQTPGLPDLVHQSRRKQSPVDFTSIAEIIADAVSSYLNCQEHQKRDRHDQQKDDYPRPQHDPIPDETCRSQSDSGTDDQDDFDLVGCQPTQNDTLEPGAFVRAFGLKARPDLNEAVGILEIFVRSKSRWQVSLDESGASVLLKPENLRLMNDEELDAYFGDT